MFSFALSTLILFELQKVLFYSFIYTFSDLIGILTKMSATKSMFKLLLLVVLLQAFTASLETSDDFTDYLWSESQSFQLAALNSAFVQGLKNVSLDPSSFGKPDNTTHNKL